MRCPYCGAACHAVPLVHLCEVCRIVFSVTRPTVHGGPHAANDTANAVADSLRERRGFDALAACEWLPARRLNRTLYLLRSLRRGYVCNGRLVKAASHTEVLS